VRPCVRSHGTVTFTWQRACASGTVRKVQWDTREASELRIVSDELWNRVQFVRTQKVTIGIRKTGGMNRTTASRRYLLSGLKT
jgi:hypothetical protein